jgi:hypothetical protein
MNTLYHHIKSYQGDYEDLFTKLNLLDIFGPIIKAFEKEAAKAVIRYLAYVYSKESEFVFAKESAERIKVRCAQLANLPDHHYQQVVYLTPVDEFDDVPAIIKGVAMKYLSYQGDVNNKDLKSLKDLYQEMVEASGSAATKHEDYEHKYKCRKYANDIKLWIEDLEKRMRDEDSHMKGVKSELKENKKAHGQALRPENAAGLYKHSNDSEN